MALNENADWELVAAQVARETDSEELRELAAEFNRVFTPTRATAPTTRDKISLMAALGSSIETPALSFRVRFVSPVCNCCRIAIALIDPKIEVILSVR
jgi:hypothetical protein